MPTITVYSTSYCPYCVRAKGLLKRKGVAYTEINVEDDAEREKMIAKAGGRRTVPQIFIGDARRLTDCGNSAATRGGIVIHSAFYLKSLVCQRYARITSRNAEVTPYVMV
ncbi:MAG: glutaredoxin [Proteobacteria bacterium]|nr:glutaredoxin [Pseudomonadota bacterium]